MEDDQKQQEIRESSSTQVEQPHQAVFLVLAFLPVFELLSMTQVCRSLRDAVTDDILPWRNIVVQKPLSSRLYDDMLIKIASMANCQVITLALFNCIKITDSALLHVSKLNPCIEKLLLPGCTGLTPQGVIQAVKMLPRLNILKITGIYNIDKADLQALHHLLGQNSNQRGRLGQNLYHKRCSSAFRLKSTSPFIDVDECPKCYEVRAVYDCTRESCRQQQLISCRGCIHCIPRCEECGVCVKDEDEAGDAACADTLCLDCWLLLPKCSFCNKPYCRQHAHRKLHYLGTSTFLCAACNTEFAQNPYQE